MSSGYAEERVKTYKNLIDLDGTIKMFNTATSPEEKQKLIDEISARRFVTEAPLSLSQVCMWFPPSPGCRGREVVAGL